MSLQLIAHAAPALNAVGPSGGLRGLASVIAHARAAPPDVFAPPGNPGAPGRVSSAGRWKDDRVSDGLATVLGPSLAPALRSAFEWYMCRGAFFHNDAHYENVLFGVWALAGPAADIVFPRVGLRLDASPGAIVVFDPFEVHGVLRPGRDRYAAEDYTDAPASLFIGFELALDDTVVSAFRVPAVSAASTLSSRTRISAATGAIE